VQSIPRAPDVSAKAGMNCFTIDDTFRKYLTDNYVTQEMHGPRATNGYDIDPEYILWFYQMPHLFFLSRLNIDKHYFYLRFTYLVVIQSI
jgi:hypothetical protein